MDHKLKCYQISELNSLLVSQVDVDFKNVQIFVLEKKRSKKPSGKIPFNLFRHITGTSAVETDN